MTENSIDFGIKKRILFITGTLLGSVSSYIFRTLFYSRESYSFKGCPKIIFDRPWFGTLFMSLGMSLALIVYLIRIKINPSYGPKLTEIRPSIYIVAMLPALCDILISLAYSFSVTEESSTFLVAFRYYNFFFILILQHAIFKMKMYSFHWMAFGIVILGIFFVSLSEFLNIRVKFNITAIILQLIAEFVFAMRTLILQKIMQHNDICPWFITGINGIYEFLCILFMIYPISYLLPESKFQTLNENLCESFMMFVQSSELIALFIIYLPFTMVYNSSVIGLIMMTDPSFFTIFEMFSGSVCWVFDILIYNVFNGKFILEHPLGMKFGQPWTKLSWLHVLGSLTFIVGGVIFIQMVRFPCFEYPQSNVTTFKIQEVESEEKAIAI